jgi:two-component system alkaline phosphatase synthesis response regulator PhoP
MSPARAAEHAVPDLHPAPAGEKRFPEQVRLTAKESALLKMLMEHPGRCLSRQTLLRTVWNYAGDTRTRTVDVHVQRLRRKLGPHARELKTIVGMGYCWLPDNGGSA